MAVSFLIVAQCSHGFSLGAWIGLSNSIVKPCGRNPVGMRWSLGECFPEISEELFGFVQLLQYLWIALKLGKCRPRVAAQHIAEFLYVTNESSVALFLGRGHKLQRRFDRATTGEEPIASNGVFEDRPQLANVLGV